ncbi:hypothetical protein C8261_08415 [Pseudothauera lacus]|uniref:Prepilin-type N-terminal cleavage/methylation domain-containing protein n=2 Tax=Pseudothauera lacus TaxID=2136175 RepID=A0A2T4IGD0_9RHOO|nr:hypothetical protein C8261_08415 [Pseudothauera lacus]
MKRQARHNVTHFTPGSLAVPGYTQPKALSTGGFSAMPQRQHQQGFTLIELVIVIVILGILAAVAIPKFISLQREARIAVVDSYYTAVKSGSNVVFAKMAAAGLHTSAAACVNLETNATGTSATAAACNPAATRVSTVYGYPQATAANLRPLFDDLPSRWTYSGGTAQLDGIPTCSVAYTAPSAAGGRPTITRDTSGC